MAIAAVCTAPDSSASKTSAQRAQAKTPARGANCVAASWLNEPNSPWIASFILRQHSKLRSAFCSSGCLRSYILEANGFLLCPTIHYQFAFQVTVRGSNSYHEFWGETNALDTFRSASRVVASRGGNQLHIGRLHSHPAGAGSDRAGIPADLGPTDSRLTKGCAVSVP